MLKLIRHNQGMVAGVVICVLLVLWTYGCHSTVKSLVNDEKVSRDEFALELESEVQRLELELDTLQKTAMTRFAEFDRQDALKRMLFETASLTATTGGFNPTALITLAGSILGIGAVVDNRIKDKVIKNRPQSKKRST